MRAYRSLVPSIVALGLLCGCNSGDEPAPSANDAGASDGGASQDAQVARDAGAPPDAGDARRDAGDDDRDATPARDASQVPEVDASFEPAANPIGHAYAETSFELVKPAGLKALLEQASTLIGEGRLFVNEYRPGSGSQAFVGYGAADAVTSAEVRWQFPSLERDSFTVAPVEGEPTRYRSQAFTYRLLARVEILFTTSYVTLTVRDTTYEAQFDAEFLTIEAGTLKGALPRSTAERSAFEVGPLCTQYCPSSFCASHSLSTLADLLDCQGSTMDVDRDGDGSPDAYALELAFRSERVLLAPHPDDQ